MAHCPHKFAIEWDCGCWGLESGVWSLGCGGFYALWSLDILSGQRHGRPRGACKRVSGIWAHSGVIQGLSRSYPAGPPFWGSLLPTF